MSTLGALWRELKRRSALHAWLGAAHLLLAVTLLVAMPFDDVILLGIDRWTKPFKFAVSIAIFLWTFGWFLDYIRSRTLRRLLEWTVAATMVVEIVLITTQAARGVTSHFNVATAMDGAVFSVMGAAIGINTLCALAMLLSVLIRPPERARLALWGLRLGLIVFLLGSGVGGALVAHRGHTVGAPDGGPGLPLVNWSTTAGDLRVAHALGLHAFQFLPLVAFWLASTRRQESRSLRLLFGVGVGYAAVTLAAFLQAIGGHPLL